MSKSVVYRVMGHIYDQNGHYIVSIDQNTSAVSKEKAVSNILFRWKKKRDIPAWHKYEFKVTRITEI